MATDDAVTIQISCTDPPDATWPGGGLLHLGIQKDRSVEELAPIDRKGLTFNPVLRVRKDADGNPNFLGPYAHGPRAERFIYLYWLAVNAGAVIASVGRIKLHLNHISWTSVQAAIAADQPIKVTLALRKANGKPVFASVRADVARWTL